MHRTDSEHIGNTNAKSEIGNFRRELPAGTDDAWTGCVSASERSGIAQQPIQTQERHVKATIPTPGTSGARIGTGTL